MYFSWILFALAIPNMGKSYYNNPDVIVGLVCALCTIISLSYFVSSTSNKFYKIINVI